MILDYVDSVQDNEKENNSVSYLVEAGLGHFYLKDKTDSVIFYVDNAWAFGVKEKDNVSSFGGSNPTDLIAIAAAALSALEKDDQQKAIKLAKTFNSDVKLKVSANNIHEYVE